VTNPLKNKNLVYWVARAAWAVSALVIAGCGKPGTPTPELTEPLPTAGLAGQQVIVLPLTMVGAEDSLHWDVVSDRRAVLDRADSVIVALLKARAPEVNWVPPAEVRRAARRAIGIATDPDQMGTAVLRADRLVQVPDPLQSELRTLAAIAGSGGRYALVPAALVYRVRDPRVDSGAGKATAELSMVLVDVRVGRVGWRTVARGTGDDEWTGLTQALKRLTPGLP